MNRKLLSLITSVLLLSGCEEISSASARTEIGPADETGISSADDVFVASDSYRGLVYEGACDSDSSLGFTFALVIQEGEINIDEPVQMRLFFGRAEEESKPHYYDDYEGCSFYLREGLFFRYEDKRGHYQVACYDKRYEDIGRIELPDLMEDKYFVHRKSTAKRVTLTSFIDISIDLKPYKNNFYNAEGYCNDVNSPNIDKPVDVDLKRSLLGIYFSLYTINVDTGIDEPRNFSILDSPWIVMKDDVFTVQYQCEDTTDSE